MFRGRHKFNAKKTVVGEDTFDSRAEADRHQVLKLLERTGQICGLHRQPAFELQPIFRHPLCGKVRAIRYIADFAYTESGFSVVEDVKGFMTADWKLKRKLFLFRYPDKRLRIVKNGKVQNETLPKARGLKVLQRIGAVPRARRRIWP